MAVCRIGLIALGFTSLLSAGLAEEDGLCALQTVQHRVGNAVQETQDDENPDEPKPGESTVPSAIESGCTAALSFMSAGKEAADNGVDVKAVSDALAGIATVVGFAVPPPAGLVAASLIGLAGGSLGLLTEEPKSITNADVISAMQKGFKTVQQTLAKINLKLDSIKKEIDDLKLIVVTHETLKQDILDEIDSKSALLQERFDGARNVNTSQLDTPIYFRQLKQDRDRFENEIQNEGTGVVSLANVANAIQELIGPSITDKCRAGDFYKRILAARFEVFHIVNSDHYAEGQVIIQNVTERKRELAMASLRSLRRLLSDLNQFKELTHGPLGVGPEALLRWELGQGRNCTAPVVGPGAMLSTTWDSLSTQCLQGPDTFHMDANVGFLIHDCYHLQNTHTEYDGFSTFIDPWTGFATNNPGNTFKFQRLCLRIMNVDIFGIHGPVQWAPCVDDPRRVDFGSQLKATGPSQPGTYATTPFQLKAELFPDHCAFASLGRVEMVKMERCTGWYNWVMVNLVNGTPGPGSVPGLF